MDQLSRRDHNIKQLEHALDQAERTADGVRVGLEVQTARLERELSRMRGSMVWRFLDRYDRAAQRLLPPGSRRRAMFERVVGPSGLLPAGPGGERQLAGPSPTSRQPSAPR